MKRIIILMMLVSSLTTSAQENINQEKFNYFFKQAKERMSYTDKEQYFDKCMNIDSNNSQLLYTYAEAIFSEAAKYWRTEKYHTLMNKAIFYANRTITDSSYFVSSRMLILEMYYSWLDKYGLKESQINQFSESNRLTIKQQQELYDKSFVIITSLKDKENQKKYDYEYNPAHEMWEKKIKQLYDEFRFE